MHRKQWFALLIFSLFLSFLLAPGHHFATAEEDSLKRGDNNAFTNTVYAKNDSVGGSIQIRLQQATFDPLQESPPIPARLATISDTNYYFVQFSGPILADWRADLERQGAVIMDYVPDFAYVVWMDDRALAQAQTLSSVRWIGLYQPAFRLNNELIAGITRGNPEAAVELIVRAFPGEPADAVARQMAGLGGAIVEQYADSGGGAIFKLVVAGTSVVDLAHIPAIAWIEPALEPQLANEVARSNLIMGKDEVETVLGLYGASQIVAVGDTGLDTGNPATVHQDFSGRVIGGTWGPGSCGTWADAHSHGTHVAGSVLGSGFLSGADIPNQDYSGSNAGIAPEALLYVWNFCNNFTGLPGAPYANYYGVMYGLDSRLRINTNSWGYTSGQGQYNTFTRETDRFIWDHQDMVLTYAAGNDGVDGNSDGVIDLNSMNMPSTAKNVITVGASENYRLTGGLNPGGPCSTWGGCWPGDYPANPINSDRLSDNENGMAAFSGRGPTLSGRLKPDVVAPGTNIVSTRNYSTGSGWGVYDANYLYMGGTSMATPLVAGASAVVRDYYTATHNIDPTAALVKATLINGAYDMTPGQYGAGPTQDVVRRPDNNQGWGRVDLPNSLIYEDDRQLWFHEHSGLNTGGSYQMTFNVLAGGSPFRATLVWSDFPGIEATHGLLVNDLDLIVEDPNGAIYLGNEILNPGNPDRINNVENVDLMPISGTYTVTVNGFNVPQGPQPFALVVTADIISGPVGYLTGMVDDGVDPIVGATVTAVATTTVNALTNASGIYTMTLPIGDYDVTASAWGYAPVTVNNVTIISGTNTIQNFSLTAGAPHVVEGVVTDAATGWPLYASLHIDGYPGSPIWTDPVTGYYNVTLFAGNSHNFTVNAWVNGYNSENRAVGPLTLLADSSEDFALNANLDTCNAPGYTIQMTSLYAENFESGYGDWAMSGLWNGQSQTDSCGALVAPFPSPTNAAYYGQPATCNYDTGAANSGSLTLNTPVSLPAATPAELSFWSYENTENFGGYDVRYVEISNNNGATWTTLGIGSTEDVWYQRTFNLAAYQGDDVQIRFRFDTVDNFANNFFGWMVDDVEISALTCVPPAGGLVVGNVYDVATLDGFNGAGVENEDAYSTTSAAAAGPAGDGFYTLYSPAGAKEFTASASGYWPDVRTPTVTAGDTIRQDFYLVEATASSYTVCATPNVAIPDNNPAGIDTTLVFTQTGEIADVNLYLRGLHTWVGDLIFTLQHPDGAPSVTAVDRPGVPASTFGCGNDNFDLWLDDEGPDGPVENQCFAPPALRNRPTPNNPLSAFNGLEAAGTWTLNASDNAAFDTGTLQEWCVEISIIDGEAPAMQVIELQAGWNIISSHILPDEANMEDVMAAIADDLILVKNGAGQFYVPGVFNGIGDWQWDEGYLVEMETPRTLVMVGEIMSETSPITLGEGWQAITYLRATPMNAEDALASIDGSFDLVKNGAGQFYVPGVFNGIGDLVPGQGYLIRMTATDTLIYPSND